MFRKILVPVDLTETDFAKPALDAAVELARVSGGEVRLMSVMQQLPGMMAEYLPADFEMQQRKEAERALDELGAGIGLHAGRVTTSLRIGGIHHEVLDEATEWGADIIVMSSHQPGMRTYLLGSNAAHVVRHAHCSVMVVRLPEAA